MENKDVKIEKLAAETEPWKVFPWEVAWLRKLDANNPNDIEMYELIDAQPEVGKWTVGETKTKEELKELFSDKDQIFYGVHGDKNEDKIEGWVSLYEPETELSERLIKKGLIKVSKGTQVLEVSFARLVDENLPMDKQKSWLIPSAIRQACFSLIEKQKNAIITAFTNPKNLLSEGALVNSGFVIKGKILYDEDSSEEDNFWVLDKNKLEKILALKKK